ncbi:MAG: transglutaminase family protein [Pseudomonadota bacterium]
MAIRVGLTHITAYRYDRPVRLSPQVLRLRPAPHARTPIEAYSLRIRPEPHFINWQQDPFGNYLARVVFPEPTSELYLEVDVVAELTVINPFDFFMEEYAERFPFDYPPHLHKELSPYFEIKDHGPLLRDWLAGISLAPRNTVDFLVYLNQVLREKVDYTVRMEPGVQSSEETLGKALGSCRDSAWLLVQILRHLGLAARFVSGYLVQLTADVKSLDGPAGPAADFTDLHAWAEVYIPGAGWVGLDPTSGLFAGEGHIPLACTPDPSSAAPLSGETGECKVEFYHHNTVQRLHEDPRVTKPYREDQWAAILALGKKVDADLDAQDVRLTMGGEPTFVSGDDMEAPEWNTAALGAHKRRLAGQLLRRLAQGYGVGGALHCGQGKWYPGEALPRWALGCFWRKDGVPIWRDPALLRTELDDEGHTSADAQRFISEVARRLGVNPRNASPGYEDTLYSLWQESGVPINLDPLQVKLNDPLERRLLAAALSRGLGTPVGYALPLQWNFRLRGWYSTPWRFRREHLFLIQGDSPMGLRLPLDSLPWVREEERMLPQERSLFQPVAALGDIHGGVMRRYSSWVPDYTSHPEIHEQPGSSPRTERVQIEVIHTALCIEARGGCLHVFLPPLAELEHYLDLVTVLEDTAQSLELPIVLEGYEPPRDLRLQRLLVTPDPGVIEVNIHPAHTWDELVINTLTLYEEAHLTRLAAEKFMLDGRHTGTGGGNHVTIGGATPSDSPVLRRPDLLRSLVTYWQHHPGLSYLFSGMFIGPTSQAPRVDEARDSALYELEIAFQQMPQGEVPQPWLVDRLLRHLLVDLTGNTHRAEFCIDKLYSPDTAQGRLGLVEFRAFEMPPHARMSVVQMLLLRVLIARFWREPYAKRLVRWGTALHDRFMLPHCVWEDMREVVREINESGEPFQLAWLEPFFDFRFPRYGTVKIQGIELELRMALEPWHVLGEEVSSHGTARYVDSSVERLQVKVTGLTEGRYVVTCNGRRVPLHATGTHGEYVAGVRYRAWQPPSALHPTIGVHAPLVFDVTDTWNGRSIGGCTYHVVHPGGRSYEVFPVNAYEAEARRISRFWPYGHTPGTLEPSPEIASLEEFFPEGRPPSPLVPPPEEINREYPYTLDLRRTPDF